MHPLLQGIRALSRSTIFATVIVGALALLPVSPSGATILDDFVDALPAHPLLISTDQPTLFLGQVCDGATCPPGVIVVRLAGTDWAEQTGLAGVLGGHRSVLLGSTDGGFPYDGGNWKVQVDPAGAGKLVLGPRGSDVYVQLQWGSVAHPLNWNLETDEGDRFQLEVLSTPRNTSGRLTVGSFDAVGAPDGSSEHAFTIPGAGVTNVPFAAFPGLDAFADDVDYVVLRLEDENSAWVDIVLGSIRTAATEVPVEPASWGRVKASYRR